MDFRKQQRKHSPIHRDGTTVKVKRIKSLSVHITDNLKWSSHTDSMVKAAQQHIFNLRKLKKFSSAPKTNKLLQMHHWKHHVRPYHHLVWLLQHPQGSPEGDVVCPTHRRETLPALQDIYSTGVTMQRSSRTSTTWATAYSHRYYPESEVSTGTSKLGLRDWKTAYIWRPSDLNSHHSQPPALNLLTSRLPPGYSTLHLGGCCPMYRDMEHWSL